MTEFERFQADIPMGQSLLANRIGLAPKTLERLFAKIRILPNGCWEWMGSRFGRGYGKIKIRAISPNGEEVHRICYQLVHGSLDSAIHLHHKVENGCIGPSCCNPDHLQETTPAEHTLELSPNSPAYINSHRDSCAAGHPYTPTNMRFRKDGTRTCRTCVRESARRWHEAHRPEGLAPHAKRPETLKMHCGRGHLMKAPNLYWIQPKAGSSSPAQRGCLACKKLRDAAFFERQKLIKAGLLPPKEKRSKAYCLHGHPMTGNNVFHLANGRGKICRKCHEDAQVRSAQKKRQANESSE